MQVRTRNTIALAVAALILVAAGIGAGVALAQSQSPSPSPSSGLADRSVRHDAFLDDVARRLGIQRSRLDDALKAQALAEVKWSEDNGFITGAEADRLRERIESGRAKGLVRFWGPGKIGLGHDGIGWKRGFTKGRVHKRAGSLMAAADYLGLTARELREALESKTLAQVARDQGKAIDGLVAALRSAKEARLDEAVAAGSITQAQQSALLRRFDSEIRDVINGIPPALTDLARRLGIDRSRLINAIKNAAIAQVDAALDDDLITKTQADAIKQRIRSSPAWPLSAKGIIRGFGPCGGLGHPDVEIERPLANLELPGAEFDL